MGNLSARKTDGCSSNLSIATYRIKFCRTCKENASAMATLRQHSDPQVSKFDRGPFRFQTQVATGRIAVFAAGNLFAVDRKADFAVLRHDVIVIPLAVAFGRFLLGKASLAVGRSRREGGHLGR